MKWLIASDIHGSVPGCRALLEAFAREGAGKLLLLGDLLNHGDADDAKATATLLDPLTEQIIAVRGNTDTDADQALVRFPLWELTRTFPTGKGPFLCVTHGHIYNSAHRPESMQPGDILLQGHTHIPMTERHASFLCFNPGSVGQPRAGSPAGYMTLEDGVFLWKTLDGTEYRRYEID